MNLDKIQEETIKGNIAPWVYVTQQRYQIKDKKGAEVDIAVQRISEAFDTFVLCLYEKWKSKYQSERAFLDSFSLKGRESRYLDENGNPEMIATDEQVKEMVLEEISDTIGEFSNLLETNAHEKLGRKVLGKVFRHEKPLYVTLRRTSPQDNAVFVGYSHSLEEKCTNSDTQDIPLDKVSVKISKSYDEGKLGFEKSDELSKLIIDYLFESKLGIPFHYLWVRRDNDTVWLQFLNSDM